MTRHLHYCQGCGEMFEKENMAWLTDAYNIPFQYLCLECYDKKYDEVKNNHYKEDNNLSYEEMYGEDYP